MRNARILIAILAACAAASGCSDSKSTARSDAGGSEKQPDAETPIDMSGKDGKHDAAMSSGDERDASAPDRPDAKVSDPGHSMHEDARVPDASDSAADASTPEDAGSTQQVLTACRDGHTPVKTQKDCEPIGTICYQIADGSWCAGVVVELCPVGFEQVPLPGDCHTDEGCFKFDEGIFCKPKPEPE